MAFDRYFDRRARRFAAFYRSEPIARALGRGPIFDRLSFAVDTIGAVGAKTVLDIGAGSGPLFAPLVKLGVAVTAVEPAPGMLELARLEAARVAGEVDVRAQSWEEIVDVEAFDVAVALGVFDYVRPSQDLLRVMARAADHVVASFPGPGLRTRLRTIRYGWRGVAVVPYTRQHIELLCADAGLTVTELRPLGAAGWVLHATVGRA